MKYLTNNRFGKLIRGKGMLILVLNPFIVFSQQSFDLKQCIKTGLEQNYQIRISKNEQKIADNNMTIGNAGFLPTVSLNSTYSQRLNNVEQIPADGSAIVKNNNVNNSAFDAGVNLNWTVFDGFRVQTNYSKLKQLQQIGELNMLLNVENFIASLSSEYFNYVHQNIQLNNLKSAVRLSKERLRIVEAHYNIGSMSRLDLQQAKVDFNADSSKLIRQKEVVFSTRVKLNQLMALKNVEEQISVTDTAIVFNALLSKDQLWKKTLQSNIYILLSEKEKMLKTIDLKQAKSRNYPYLKLNAGYGYVQNKYEYNAYRQQNQLGSNLGLTLGFTLFDGFNRSREQTNAEVGKMMEEELVNLKLITKDEIKNQNPEWPAYKKYFMHGTSHFLGLDVHDVGNKYQAMQAGMVFTCEPGIYIPEESIGIRIENNILITDKAPVDLMATMPVEVSDIESLMRK